VDSVKRPPVNEEREKFERGIGRSNRLNLKIEALRRRIPRGGISPHVGVFRPAFVVGRKAPLPFTSSLRPGPNLKDPRESMTKIEHLQTLPRTHLRF